MEGDVDYIYMYSVQGVSIEGMSRMSCGHLRRRMFQAMGIARAKALG